MKCYTRRYPDSYPILGRRAVRQSKQLSISATCHFLIPNYDSENEFQNKTKKKKKTDAVYKLRCRHS